MIYPIKTETLYIKSIFQESFKKRILPLIMFVYSMQYLLIHLCGLELLFSRADVPQNCCLNPTIGILSMLARCIYDLRFYSKLLSLLDIILKGPSLNITLYYLNISKTTSFFCSELLLLPIMNTLSCSELLFVLRLNYAQL